MGIWVGLYQPTQLNQSYKELEETMTKPNTTFKLSIRDVEVIEQALRNKAGRRGMAIAQGDTSPELKAEMYEIQDVVGRIHEQKNFYAKFKDGQPYVSG